MKAITLAFLLLTTTCCLAQDWFQQGNTAYESQAYDSAQVAYSHLVQEQPTFEAHFNLGNAEFRLGNYAQAILSYERARLINPFDEDLLANISIAEGRIQDEIENKEGAGFTSFSQALNSRRALSWYAIATLVLAFLCALLLALATKKSANRRSYRSLALILGVCALFTLSLGLWSKSQLNQSSAAIVMASSVDVMTAPNGSDIAFVLHAGTKVEVKEVSDDWINVAIANGEVGWLPVMALEFIAQKK